MTCRAPPTAFRTAHLGTYRVKTIRRLGPPMSQSSAPEMGLLAQNPYGMSDPKSPPPAGGGEWLKLRGPHRGPTGATKPEEGAAGRRGRAMGQTGPHKDTCADMPPTRPWHQSHPGWDCDTCLHSTRYMIAPSLPGVLLPRPLPPPPPRGPLLCGSSP